VADGYASVADWRAGESNILKLVVLADEWEGFVVDTDSSGRYSVDWNGDGVYDASYADNTCCSNIYSGADIGTYKAVTVRTWGATNIVSAEFTYDADSKVPNGYSVLAGAKRKGIVEVVFPLEVTSLTDNALLSVTELRSASFPGVTAVGTYALQNCHGLEFLSIPKVTSISAAAFNNCYALQTFTATNLTSTGSSVMSGCRALRSVHTPKLGAVGVQLFYECYNLSSVTALPLWTSIAGSSAFSACNLGYDAITNIAANLPYRADLQTVGFLYNPGASAARAWYVADGFAVSNALNELNWKLTF
jgi:hypothetical protein